MVSSIKKHPFTPLISPETKKLLIGTLPPENAKFYFCNSSNTRLWDLLRTIADNTTDIYKYSNNMENNEKKIILKKLGLGLTDIIYHYHRRDFTSTKDRDIIPVTYLDINTIIENSQISTLLFLYKNAAKWFIEYINAQQPKPISRVKVNLDIEADYFYSYQLNNRIIKCALLPAPLNRGRLGETLIYKLSRYRGYILGAF